MERFVFFSAKGPDGRSFYSIISNDPLMARVVALEYIDCNNRYQCTIGIHYSEPDLPPDEILYLPTEMARDNFVNGNYEEYLGENRELFQKTFKTVEYYGTF
jgi:hypothetical protein